MKQDYKNREIFIALSIVVVFIILLTTQNITLILLLLVIICCNKSVYNSGNYVINKCSLVEPDEPNNLYRSDSSEHSDTTEYECSEESELSESDTIELDDITNYPGSIDACHDDKNPCNNGVRLNSDSIIINDGDELLARQNRSRNDPERVWSGIYRRKDIMDRYVNEELDEEENSRWWGSHEI